jgi:hypothetical protein
MSESLHIAVTRSTPLVRFEPVNGKFEVTGISTPINSFGFYSQLIQWLDEHAGLITSGSVFRFDLPYFNSASMKALLILLQKIKAISDTGKNLEIEWLVRDEDEFMEEAADSLQELLGMPIRQIRE